MKNILIAISLLALLLIGCSKSTNDKDVAAVNSLRRKLLKEPHGTRISGTSINLDKDTIHKIIFINDKAFNWSLPSFLIPRQMSEVEYLAYIEKSEVIIEECTYRVSGYPSREFIKKRIQKKAFLTVFNSATGQLLDSTTIIGAPPQICTTIPKDEFDIYGPEITYSDYKVWLSSKVTNLPLIELDSICDITPFSATCSVKVLYTNCPTSEIGICWSENTIPLITDKRTICTFSNGKYYCNLNQLVPDMKYYGRAFISNKYGTFYSNEFSFVAEQKIGTFTDIRDNHSYNWVKIGDQIWMAENLAYKSVVGSSAYDNDTSYVSKYGYLYNWQTACKVCPKGWHLPSATEWDTLTAYLGGEEIAIGKLKSITGWGFINEGATNESGFGALPGGKGFPNSFGDVGERAYFYTSSTDGYWARGQILSNNNSTIYNNPQVHFEELQSVRCIKDTISNLPYIN
jgi:uncharacterized protein (TIGR02145 family)